MQKYYFVAELPPPLLALYEMSKSRLAGLTVQQRDAQREIFIDKLEEILENSDHKNDVTMLRYNGSLSKLIFLNSRFCFTSDYISLLFHIFVYYIIMK